MSRLVAVSNRISVPRRGAAPGGLAVGLLAAMQARRGMWFGWDGETVEIRADEPSVVRKDGVTYASIDFDQAEYKDFYLGFCNATLVAAVPLFRRRIPLQRRAVRGLPAHEPALRAAARCRCSSRPT